MAEGMKMTEILKGMKMTEVMKVSDGAVRVCRDSISDTYSIGLRTEADMEFKMISKELYDLLVKELVGQEGLK